MDELIGRLGGTGRERVLLPSAPERLGREKRVLLVVDGTVDVRGVLLSKGRDWGPREPLFSLEPGEFLWDAVADDASYALEMTARDRVRLIVFAWEELDAAELPLKKALQEGMEAFLDKFGLWLARSVPPLSVAPERAEGPGPHPCSADSFFAAPSEARWALVEEGDVALLGEETVERASALFVGDALWLRGLSEGAVRWLSARDLSGRDMEAALEGTLSLYRRLAFLHGRLDLADQWNLSRSMAAQGREQFASALGDLGSLLSRKEEHKGPPPTGPLMKIAYRLGELQGFSLPQGLRHPESIVTVEDLGRALSLRVRKVTLERDWWKDDGLPLIAFRGEERKPVALLPGRGRYGLYDPSDDSKRPLDATRAAELEREAYAVYRPFPPGRLTKRDLFSFGLFRSGREILVAVVAAFAMGGLGLLVPVINGKVFQDVIPAAERGQIVEAFVVLLALGLSTALLRLFQQISLFRVESRMDHDIEMALWDRMLRLRATFFRRYSAGDLANRAFGLNSVHQYMSQSGRTVVTNFVYTLLFLAQMFYYDWKVALAAAGCLSLLGSAMALTGYIQIRFQRKMVALQNRLSGLVLQILTGLNKIRVAAAEEPAFARWAYLFGAQRLCNYRSARAAAILSGFASAFPPLCAVVIFLVIMYGRVGYPDDMGKAYDLGRFVSFWSAYGAMQGAFLSLVSTVATLFAVLPLYEALSPILDEEPEVGDHKADPGPLRGKIDMTALTFRYHRDAPVLFQNFSLSIRPGEFVAVVGPSGAGKSTLIRLLLGFEFPEVGDVFYDDKPLKDMDLRKVRSQIGVVLQQGGIIAGDLFSNIVCSRPLSIEQAWEAARVAGLEEDIKAMPMGMHTMITEGANTLSGGQRQRLAIARAVVARPAILLFDEATSALDNRTQDEVSRSLERLKATRIVVAHRLSTVRNADRIVVVAGGGVAEEGTFDDLLARRGLFYELSLRQMT
ncbi:NHLP bacteriocin export ABC transporter permease/ATPase subunit [Aminithiophilus ramosus]|uniref:NHLP bacteriocin export ABC transporter permease/ATPase subunit n=2 Tax=Synergistales TaxID=649776 RepID=A0A9Q7AEP7_9BACT|nr:NHLP bacteriocin export ABC transporter permease/ATPase subunit [Aminithiophilus ramosus]QTX33318.1 NHLP bacteriocin export ABC transporter permease/ATPase subunit [Aminithiophilus ramosus]QVL36934.1 NHLP bacteriocin export ABC transporter permease/ATPase subunit [Synergistota bacterium]